MKKITLCAFLMLFTVTMAHAEHGPYYAIDDIKKLNRGAINIATSPLEIPYKIKDHWKESSNHPVEKGVYLFGGAVKGVAWTVGRFGSGLWDIFTFNLKTSEDNAPLMKPTYIYQTKEQKKSGKGGTHKLK